MFVPYVSLNIGLAAFVGTSFLNEANALLFVATENVRRYKKMLALKPIFEAE